MADKSNKNVIEDLQGLGLTDHESVIYLAVLKHGEVSAGVVLDEVKLHREQVYRALKRLVDQGLLTTYEKRKRAYYAATNPDVFVKEAERQVSLAKSVQPFLKQLHKAKPQIITVWEGEDAIKNHLEDQIETLKDGGEYLILGCVSKDWYNLVKKYGDYYTKRFAKQKITGRIIFFEGEKPSDSKSYGETWSSKTIKRPGTTPVSTVIFGDKIALEWIQNGNCTVISIENKELAESYRQTFETLWK